MTQKVSVAPKQPAPLNRYDAKLIRFISIGVFGHAGPRRPPTRASPNRQCEIDQLREHCKNQRKQPRVVCSSSSGTYPKVGGRHSADFGFKMSSDFFLWHLQNEAAGRKCENGRKKDSIPIGERKDLC